MQDPEAAWDGFLLAYALSELATLNPTRIESLPLQAWSAGRRLDT